MDITYLKGGHLSLCLNFQMTLPSLTRQFWHHQLSLARSRYSEVKAGFFYPTPLPSSSAASYAVSPGISS